MNWFVLIALAPLVFSFVPYLIGEREERKRKEVFNSCLTTTGTVVSVRKVHDRKAPDRFYPTVGYYIDGEYREKESYRSFSIFEYTIGESGILYYPPDDPDSFILGFSNDYMGKASSDGKALSILMIIGSAFLLFAVLMRSCGVL